MELKNKAYRPVSELSKLVIVKSKYVSFFMSRKLRYLPDDNHLVEVTCRVIHRRFLLRPSPRLNAIVIGTLARFQKLSAIEASSQTTVFFVTFRIVKPISLIKINACMRPATRGAVFALLAALRTLAEYKPRGRKQ